MLENEFETTVAEFYQSLLVKQEPLGEPFQKILHENLWDLYESTDDNQGKAEK